MAALSMTIRPLGHGWFNSPSSGWLWPWRLAWRWRWPSAWLSARRLWSPMGLRLRSTLVLMSTRWCWWG